MFTDQKENPLTQSLVFQIDHTHLLITECFSDRSVPRVGHLCVDLSSDAGRCYIQVDVVLLVQTQIAVTHQVQCVDTPETRRYMGQQVEQKHGYTGSGAALVKNVEKK